MQSWEYCAFDVTLYNDGTGSEPRELLHITLPGAHRANITNAYGSIGLLNQLGGEGWRLVAVENGTCYLRRAKKA